MSLDNLLTKTCTIQVCTRAQAANGQKVETWSTYQANAPLMLTGAKGGRADFREDVIATMTHIGFIRYDANITWKDYRLLIGSTVYVILDVCNPASRNHHLELALQVIQ